MLVTPSTAGFTLVDALSSPLALPPHEVNDTAVARIAAARSADFFMFSFLLVNVLVFSLCVAPLFCGPRGGGSLFHGHAPKEIVHSW